MYNRYEKVKKCFTDQNMLNTVKTKSVAVLSLRQPFLLFKSFLIGTAMWVKPLIIAPSNAEVSRDEKQCDESFVYTSLTALLSPSYKSDNAGAAAQDVTVSTDELSVAARVCV